MSAISLPEIFDQNAARDLMPQFTSALSSGAIEVYGQDVIKVGLVGLQLLMSVKRSATEQALPFALREPSDTLLEVMALAGVSKHLLTA
jgi:ABC-type transporter Mla MlaB component